jgi:ATP-dependent DNA ligase
MQSSRSCPNSAIRSRVAELEANLPDLIRSVRVQGLEGLVAKPRDSRHEAGERTVAWRKMRVNRGQD